jgi:predicted transcriptional regulator of viral defense system
MTNLAILNPTEREILEFLRRVPFARASEVERAGFHREYLRSLVAKGLATRIARGVYAAGDGDELIDRYATAFAHVPGGVICLLSALAHHGVTTQNPHQLWMAISRKDWRPSVPPAIRLVTYADTLFLHGSQPLSPQLPRFRVYCLERTVVDCFKFRHLVGLDVAIEALRDVRRRRLASVAEIGEYARALKVERFMRPYLEAVQ